MEELQINSTTAEFYTIGSMHTWDIGVIVVFALLFIGIAAMVAKTKVHGTQEVRTFLITALLGFGCLLVFGVLKLTRLEGIIAADFLLSVSTGSFAAVALLAPAAWVSWKDPADTTYYHVSWAFSDGKFDDMITLTITVTFHRHNRSSNEIHGLTNAALESYPWRAAYDWRFFHCANSRAELDAPDRRINIPILNHVHKAEVNTNDGSASAAILEVGASRWYRWQASMQVVENYMDVMVGNSSLLGESEYEVVNSVSRKSMKFSLRPTGSEGCIGDAKETPLRITRNVDEHSRLRCTVRWWPLEIESS